MGIAGMRARASEIGSTLVVTSTPGTGSRIEVAVPPERPVEAQPEVVRPSVA
ncbi:MAG: hypothetical protein R3C32_08150 [Chloroflexota bacterium]